MAVTENTELQKLQIQDLEQKEIASFANVLEKTLNAFSPLSSGPSRSNTINSHLRGVLELKFVVEYGITKQNDWSFTVKLHNSIYAFLVRFGKNPACIWVNQSTTDDDVIAEEIAHIIEEMVHKSI